MGCICSKGIKKDGIVAEAHRSSGKDPSVVKPSLRRLKEVPVVPHVESPPEKGNADSTASTKPCGSFAVEEKAAAATTAKIKSVESGRHLSLQHRTRATADSGSTGIHRVRDGSGSNLGIPDVPNGFFGEHVVAGWPGWLTSVAGEAIKGWLPRTTDSFEKLDKIGQGTYSSVYRARDLETGRIVALKKVRFVNMDPESVRFMAREINILRGLDHLNVIKLEGIVMSRTSCSLYLVFEYMDHDLAGLAATPGIKFTEAQIKCFMQQLLSGLDHCHSRGVLHRDIKGANLLVDSNGVLRVGDFGLAAVLDPGRKQPLTSRVVTLWYRPPELLLGATDYDAAVDLWSSGCILAELLAGKPIMPGRTEVEQLHNIFKLCGSPSEEYWSRPKVSDTTIFKPTHPYPRLVTEVFREFPSSALALLDTLLAIEPEDRGTAASALQSEFFTIMPLACHPSSLPKFAPSKEYGAKLRDEEARRKREGAEEEIGPRKKRDRKPKLEKENCMEEQKRQANPKICSEKYNPHDDISSGVPIDPPREHEYPRAGGSTTAAASNAPRLMSQRSSMPQPGHARDLSNSEKPRKLDRTVSSHKNEDGSLAKDSTMNYGSKNIRIHYSGPLVPQGGNIDDMLKEHERQIQQAVRKARLDKVKTREG